jgi:hypothetical protein
LGVYIEVLLPCLSARMVKREFGRALCIMTGLEVSLEEITGVAGESQIGVVIRSSMRSWDDVLHLEGKVEDQLGRVTVLATVVGPLGDGRVQGVHG